MIDESVYRYPSAMSGLEDHPSQTYAVDTLAVHVTSWHSTKIHIYAARAADE